MACVPLGLSLVPLITWLLRRAWGLGLADSLRLSAPAVRPSITSRYETVYRSTTAQEEAALHAATAQGTGMMDCGSWGSSMGEQAPFSEAG